METAVGVSLASYGGSLENVYSSSTAGFNLYLVSAFGNTTLVSSFGDIGNVKYSANGGLTFENQTAGAYAGEVSVGSYGGGTYSGDNIFFKTWTHYQFGGTDDLHVSTSALDFSFVSQKNLSYNSKTNTYSLNLFSLNKTSQTSLALGKVSLNSVGNNLYTINPDLYDFNIEWNQRFSTRNIATFWAGLIHGPVIDNVPIPAMPMSPFFGPSFYFGGAYEIFFHGTVYIKP